ncbi:MAG: sigma-70 family RNA polymerase sigma factor [Polyangiaceae bacterium]|nr:sigma-70 family RNA polymerase sigma factor [Polyangiaceae bacterium]
MLFPTTPNTAVERLNADSEAERQKAMKLLAEVYVGPLYKYARAKFGLSPDTARDAIQSFFLAALEDRLLSRYSNDRARFRTFVRKCFDHFTISRWRADRAAKRGAHLQMISLDFSLLEDEHQGSLAAAQNPERYFEQEWTRSFFLSVLCGFEEYCTAKKCLVHYQLFCRSEFSEDEPSYATMAKEFELSVTDVTNRLSFARRTFRRLALQRLRQVTASEEEYRSEAAQLFGTPP